MAAAEEFAYVATIGRIPSPSFSPNSSSPTPTARRIGERKTLLCRYWGRTVCYCYLGDECRFAHGEEEIRLDP
ncbi:hypothetical protein E2562_007389 [Oryza meyeriana var. granulata]|uniref:C3H1-type domain-containing protein n=1 Tax=Oryza meyeriana var. granulata TaxID=110450 RepID=A0A6G1CZM4_9ORYZ|nr:hypothetical protein E2562_007389 [Oryza meyeriana var. granulata]